MRKKLLVRLFTHWTVFCRSILLRENLLGHTGASGIPRTPWGCALPCNGSLLGWGVEQRWKVNDNLSSFLLGLQTRGWGFLTLELEVL